MKQTKICKQCGVEKPLASYSLSRTSYRTTCKECMKESMAKRRAEQVVDVPPPQEQEAPLQEAALTLAQEYAVDVDFVSRSLEACDLAGETRAYFVERYLKGNKKMPFSAAVDRQARIIQGLIRKEAA